MESELAPDRTAFIDGFLEDRDRSGTLRPGYAQLFGALAKTEPDALKDDVTRGLADRGVTFAGRTFVIDPLPRLISGDEWDELCVGLTQRARALNHFLRDAYGEREIVRGGLVAEATITGAEGFEPDLVGALPPHPHPAAIIGFDVIRAPDGAFLVLEDNVRTPSGYAYALAAREVLLDTLPGGYPAPRETHARTLELLRGSLHAAAPWPQREPSIVVLTDGPDNVAYYEHRRAAESLGATLATPDQLWADGEGMWVQGPDEPQWVDVVYRRTDEDRIRDEHGRLTAVAGLLLPSWLSGRIGLINAFGNGLADDKLVHGHVEDFIRFYLDEEPQLHSVPTDPAAPPQDRAAARRWLRGRAIKPRHGHGGVGVVIGAHAQAEDLDRLLGELHRHPERFISQPIVPLSLHPTVVDRNVEHRHVDLRPFAFCGEEVGVMPGGLSRVAFDAGALVVNSSQNGGGKDTWVIAEQGSANAAGRNARS